jgi:hypothetical protein
MSYSPQNDRLFNDADDPEWDTVQIESEQKTPVVVYFHAFFLVIASVLVRNINNCSILYMLQVLQ